MKHFCSFSEAIREGAKLRPQAFVGFFRDGATCAYGAGVEAIFESVPDMPLLTQAEQMFPYLGRTIDTPCPTCDEYVGECIEAVIYHLNDLHLWTREQIADWLESEEEKLGFVTISEPESLRSESPELTDVTA